jgi:hypothetical protein
MASCAVNGEGRGSCVDGGVLDVASEVIAVAVPFADPHGASWLWYVTEMGGVSASFRILPVDGSPPALLRVYCADTAKAR